MKPIYPRRPRKLYINTVLFLWTILLLIPFLFYYVLIHTLTLTTSSASIPELFVSDMEVIATPDPKILKQVNINQSIEITVEFTARDKHTILSQLQGHFGQTNSSLQQFLGDYNTACISAVMYANTDQFNVVPDRPQEYPLDQQSIIWSWIVTPKQAGDIGMIEISFAATGKSVCSEDKDPIKGPYLLDLFVLYHFTTIDPNNINTPTATSTFSINTSNTTATPPDTSNMFVQMFNELGINTIITGTLTTLLASLVTWICTQEWKRRKNKTKNHTHSKVSTKSDPLSPSKQPRRNGSRRSRKKANNSRKKQIIS